MPIPSTKREQLAWQRFGALSKIITASRVVALNATIAYISPGDPAYEMSDIRANFDLEMQAFRRGVRFHCLAFLVLTRYRGTESIAMRSETIPLVCFFHLTLGQQRKLNNFVGKSHGIIYLVNWLKLLLTCLDRNFSSLGKCLYLK